MKNLVRYGIIICAILPRLPWAAGLDLSDTPMFVAEVLAPNVVITPVYNVGYNESVLKDVPWGDPVKAEFLAGVNAAGVSIADPAWHSSQLVIGRGAFRVTPWPNTVVSTSVAPTGNCHPVAQQSMVDIAYACSETSLYPGDVYEDAVAGFFYNNPLSYQIKDSDHLFGAKWDGISTHYTQEVYPQNDADLQAVKDTGEQRYDKAKSRYFHSDSNFLYFNPAAANAYQPWPALDGPAFLPNSPLEQARYSPLPARAAAGSVPLDVSVDNWLTLTGGNPNTKVVPYKAYVGQYWVKTPGADVTDFASFVGTCWGANAGVDCSNVMDNSRQLQFSNWFTYWRSSNLATRGMLGNLFDRLKQADLLDKFRFGISTNVNNNTVINGFYSLVNPTGVTDPALYTPPSGNKAAKTANLLETVRNTIYSDSTRFAKAWNYEATDTKFREVDAYRDTPGGPIRSCRRNYEILLTPDYSGLAYQGTQAPQPADNYDAAATLAGIAPYPDNHSGMWSDLGALGWATDLCKDAKIDPCGNLDNNLLPGLRDPATHQHVVRYIIGPNAEGGSIFPKGALSYQQATDYAKTATWPAKPIGTHNEFTSTYDDLWHMALNSYGFYYPSDNIKDAVTNLLDAFNDIITRNISGSSVATNTTSLQSGGQIYQATVESDWKGHLRAYSVVAVANVISIDYATPIWDVAAKVSAVTAASRNILTYNIDTNSGAPFSWDSIGAAAQTKLKAGYPSDTDPNKAVKAQKLLDYLRGSGECEDGATTSCSVTENSTPVPYTFRRRNIDRSNNTAYSLANPNGRNVLGDISNSNPWYVPPPRAGISDVDYPGYNKHRVDNKSRLNVLYVGANDGMLHAILTDGQDAGTELFAYIPSFVHDNLPALADRAYGHKFYVDGSPFSAEVNIENVGWRTVLAGGANKGGKGYYLFDITQPNAFAAASVLWEFTHPDMHYTFNLPVAFPDSHSRVGQARQIARMSNGKWALIVGNGYPEEAAKQACLFIIDLSGPVNGVWTENTNYRKFCVGAQTYAADGGLDTNGLSTPTPYDLNGDGNVDVIYAGDLNGNMWRFDVADPDPANWAAPTSPLFVAKEDASDGGQRQPITVPPEATQHTVGNISGRLVLFGTGKYIEPRDRDDRDGQGKVNVQSFYGIWDRNDAAFTNMTRSVLYQQSFKQATSSNVAIRKQDTKVPITYCAGAALGDCNTVNTVATDKMGWYWDMGDDVQHNIGERLTGRVNLFNGIVFLNTFYPVIDATGALDPCQYGGSGWIMGLNAASGYMEDQQPTFDVNRNGVIDSSEVNSAGVKLGAAIGGTTFSRGAGGSRVGVYSPTDLGSAASESDHMRIVINTGPNSSRRVSWYELLD